ncbi:MAG: SoxR reducing system RseC family protein, partial [Megasphaera sp.]|nr:SoxR reducing system RseC family protein [Megasphaera sp.]
MKIEEGTIIAIKEAGSAEIKVGRHSDCIACGACDGADNIVVTAVDPLGVKVGQHVRFEFRDVNIVIGAFICFVMPLLVCAAGAFAGHFLALSQGFDTVQTAVIGGVIGFMIGAVGVKLFDR